MTNRGSIGWLLILAVAVALLFAGRARGQVATAKDLQAKLSQFRQATVAGVTIELTEPLKITATLAGGITGNGAGSLYPSQAPGYPTRLKYVGPKIDGAVIVVDKALGCLFEGFEIDANGRAANCIELIDTSNQWGQAHHRFERVYFRNALGAAVSFGREKTDLNCSDAVFDQCAWLNCGAAIRVNNDQGVNFLVAAPTIIGCNIAYDFVRGGNLSATGGHYGQCDTILRVGNAGPNASNFAIRDARVEMNGKTRQVVTLADARALDVCRVTFDGCQETDGPFDGALTDNRADPLFITSLHTTVRVNNHGTRGDRAIMSGAGRLQHDGTAWAAKLVWGER